LQRVDQQMTKVVAEASLRNPQSSAIKCLKCDCSSKLCYVVMKNKSIQKSSASLVSTVVPCSWWQVNVEVVQGFLYESRNNSN
jgi:hypothetical protein